MKLVFEYRNVSKRIEYKSVIGNLIKVLIEEEGKRSGRISIIFTSNPDIFEINKTFLRHEYFTDVITFPDNKKDRISGEIFISLDQVAINSKIYKTRFSDEVTRVIIHGILHLIGYNDSNEIEKLVMREKEDHYLCMFNKIDLIR